MSTKKELVRKWERASLKDSVVFSWIVSEHQDVCLRLLQLILPKLQITSVHDVKGEYIAELKQDSEKRLGYMELEQEIVAREEYAKKKALEEEREKIVKNMLNEGYTKEQIIDLMPKLTGMTQNDMVALYDKLCVK